MSIQVGQYYAEGPFGNIGNLMSHSGVYVILGRSSQAANWNIVDVGESHNIRERISSHERKPCWIRQGFYELAVAVIYCDHHNRKRIEQELRSSYRPPCGQF